MIMITWLLAGFDVLENPYPFELYSSRAGRLPDHGHAATPGGDFVYSADHSRLHHSHFAEQRPAPLLIGYATLAKARQGLRTRRAFFDCWNCADRILEPVTQDRAR